MAAVIFFKISCIADIQAYKNFGARINNMKKKLDELKRTFPQPDSPIPSPDVNAPSPGNTPPHLGSTTYSYNPSAQGGNYRSGLDFSVVYICAMFFYD